MNPIPQRWPYLELVAAKQLSNDKDDFRLYKKLASGVAPVVKQLVEKIGMF